VNPILETALEVQRFCRSRHWRFSFIGAIAVQRWGEPRLTQDVDLTVLSASDRRPSSWTRCSRPIEVDPRRPGVRAPAPDRALEAASGVPIDVSLGGIPFEERVVERSSAWDVGGDEPLATCSAEDLVVLKAFAGPEKDAHSLSRLQAILERSARNR